jgi:type II secretory pathway pseudopilin PulG
MSSAKKNSGFTLTEVVFAVAVSFMTIGVVASLTSNMLQFSEEEQIQNEIERETTLFLEHVKRDVKHASEVVLDYPAVAGSQADVLVFKMPEFDEGGVAIPGQFDYVTYEHFWETDKTRRTVYDDDLGLEQKEQKIIDAGECWFWAFANGEPIEYIADPDMIDTIQISAYRQDYEPNGAYYYWRSFVVASALRNH